MARLSRIGAAVDPDGRIIWAWTFPTNWVFSAGWPEEIPVREIDPVTGDVTRVLFVPGETDILDLTESLTHTEMQSVLRERRHIRWRKQADGTRRLTRLSTDEITGLADERPHEFQARLEKRAAVKTRLNLSNRAATRHNPEKSANPNNGEEVLGTGFKSNVEVYATLAALDLENPDTLAATESWADGDGEKDGLLVLLKDGREAYAARAVGRALRALGPQDFQ